MRSLLLGSITVASIALVVGCGSSGDDNTGPAADTGTGDETTTFRPDDGVESAPLDSGTVDSTTTDTGTPTDSTVTDSGTDTTATDTTPTDSTAADTKADAADTATGDTAETSASFTLKIEDYLNWCKVSVNGGADSTAATQTFSFSSGTVVNLKGDTAGTLFVWGYWTGTAGDTTSSHDTAKTTTVTMTGNKVVQACCPLASSPTTPCPAPTP